MAAADGTVTGVREGGIGGKVVWLRPEGKAISLYYAHLDEQLVREGQSVKKGDVLGLVGNTGNARTTPAHLHFGVYGFSGPTDPAPYVNRTVRTAEALPQKKLDEYLRLVKDVKTNDRPLPKNTLLLPLAVTEQGYLAEGPDNAVLTVSFSAAQSAGLPLKKARAVGATLLYAGPATDAAVKSSLPAGTTVSVLGYAGGFAFVRTAAGEGWLPDAVLKS